MPKGLARFLRAVFVGLGLVLVLIALIVFLSQRSEIQVRAQVLNEQCFNAYNPSIHQTQTLCNLDIKFTTRSGQVIRTSFDGALQSEITTAGNQQVIELRYYSNDPSQPLDQGSVMSAPIFVVLVVLGCAFIVGAGWPRLLARVLRYLHIMSAPA
jgi:hypothetical protein